MDMNKIIANKIKEITGLTISQPSATHVFNALTNYYQSIIESMPGNVYWLNNDCRCIGCNRNVLNMLQLKSVKDFNGLSFEELSEIGGWTESATESFRKDTLDVIKTKQPKLNIEEPPIPNASGKLTYFLTSRVPIFTSSGEVVGVIGISIDITERKEMENSLIEAKQQTEQANQFKSDFIANMSHDLRTPLSSIIGLSDLLLNNAAEHLNNLYLTQINQSANELLRISNEVLEIVSTGARSTSDHLKTFSISKLFDRLSDALMPVSTHKKIDLHFEIDDLTPPSIHSSYFNIHRVLLNLIGNSLKFTQKGSITCSVKAPKPGDKNIQFIVRDTGIGIDEDKLETVFEPFKRLTRSYESNIPGSGLGLYMVRTMLTEAGGSITLTSKKNQGTTATVTIPFSEAHNDSAANITPENLQQATPHTESLTTFTKKSLSTQPAIDSDAPQQSALKILVVEDNLPAQIIARSQLEKLGYSVTVADTGSEALKQAADTTFDLIFMDIGLPDCNGIEATRHIRQDTQSASQYTPIIALTAHANKEERENCLATGINLVLHKPLTTQKTQKIIDVFLTIGTF